MKGFCDSSYRSWSAFRCPESFYAIECRDCMQMGTVTKIPGNKPDIAQSNPVAENAGGSASPEEAKPNA